MGNWQRKKQTFISKNKNINCMKESNSHNRANAKSMLKIAKGKIGAKASHRRVEKGGVLGRQVVGSTINIER